MRVFFSLCLVMISLLLGDFGVSVELDSVSGKILCFVLVFVVLVDFRKFIDLVSSVLPFELLGFLGFLYFLIRSFL